MSTSFQSAYDLIQIIVVDNPKEEEIIRKTVYKTECSEIYFNSQQYSGDKGYWQQNWGNFRQQLR